MIGHQQIIECRRRRWKPSSIFIEAGLEPAKWNHRMHDPEQAIAHDLFPTVWVPDLQVRHDLRFVADCTVHMHALELTDEVLAFAERVAELAYELILCDGYTIMIHKNNNWEAYADAD